MMSTSVAPVAAIVLAAGKGTRMKSELPKVLHPLSGLPMVAHVLKTIRAAGISHICCVIGGDTELLTRSLKPYEPLTFTVQSARLGTGEAVACAGFAFQDAAVPAFASGHALSGPLLNNSHVLICAGDTPALDGEVIQKFLSFCLEKGSRLAVLAMDHPQPFGYGRILRDEQGHLLAIVEEKDASPTEKSVRLCNSGVIFAERTYLFELLQKIKPNNSQKEYYLTDCFQLAREAGHPADVYITPDFEAFDGVNDRLQLARLEQRLQRKLKEKWMQAGVSFRLPDTCYLDESVTFDADTVVGPNSSLLGRTRIGKGCEIGSHVVLKNVIIPDHTQVPAGTVRLQPD